MRDETRDVIVLGGGLAGLSAVLHIRQLSPEARITVIEKHRHPVPEAAFKVGESTVEIGAHYFGKVLGLEQHILDEQLPKLGLRFFFGADDNSRIEPRLELGSSRFAVTPSYQLDRGRFENHLGQLCQQQEVEFLDDARVTDVEVRRGRQRHQVEFQRDGQSHTREGRWLVDASGRAALLKRKLSLHEPSPHHANAAWFRVGRRICIDDWSDDPQWRDAPLEAARWYSTNHLMGDGYWVWLIPLASGSTSVGIVADERLHPLSEFNSLSKALAWLDRHEPQCAERVRDHEDQVQDFLAVKRYALQCRQMFSKDRWAITGEAGYFLDPFYSPGSDFIAFANTFLSDLIARDLGGKGIRFRSFLYGMIYRNFFHGTAHVYQDQYPLFGHHQAMSVKILWDYLIYWSLPCHVFIGGRLCDSLMYPRNMRKLRRLRKLNQLMQELLRQWHRQRPAQQVRGSVDISSIPLLREMNATLTDQLGSRKFDRRFADNVAQVETVFWEIVDFANLDAEVPLRRRRHSTAVQGAFDDLFRVIAQPAAAPGPAAKVAPADAS